MVRGTPRCIRWSPMFQPDELIRDQIKRSGIENNGMIKGGNTRRCDREQGNACVMQDAHQIKVNHFATVSLS